MFTSEGSIRVRIDDVKIAEPKFAKGATDFDVCIHGTSVDDPNQGDYARLEMSQNYGKKNFASMTQAEITLKTLRKLGFEGNDFTTLLDQLKDKIVSFHVEASDANDDGKVFYNVKYIETGAEIKEIDMSTVNDRVAALFAKEATPAPAPQETKQPIKGNPFAKQPATGTASATTTAKAGAKLPF